MRSIKKAGASTFEFQSNSNQIELDVGVAMYTFVGSLTSNLIPLPTSATVQLSSLFHKSDKLVNNQTEPYQTPFVQITST